MGYGTTVSDIDLGVALIVSDDLGDQEGGEGEALVFCRQELLTEIYNELSRALPAFFCR